VQLEPSDRFLLYTDGVTETENAAGEAFGDRQLERVVRNNRLQPAYELSRQVLSELQKWRPTAVNQQDDITLSSSMFFSRPGIHLKSHQTLLCVSDTSEPRDLSTIFVSLWHSQPQKRPVSRRVVGKPEVICGEVGRKVCFSARHSNVL